MARQGRSAEDIERLLVQYRASGMTQRMYCRQTGVGLSTLSRYLQQRRDGGPRFIPVKLRGSGVDAEPEGFVLVLGKGRRIQSNWRFQDAELARLIRVVEGA